VDRTRQFAIYGALQLVAIVRYPATVNWLSPQAWLYALFPVLRFCDTGLG